MDRYSLPSQSVRILAAVTSGVYAVSLDFQSVGLVGHIGAVILAAAAGYLLGFLVPKPLIRWTLDRQAVVGSFVISYLTMLLIAAGVVFAMMLSESEALSFKTVGLGFVGYMIFGGFAALIGAVFAWYPTLATFLYLRDRRDYL